MEMRMTTDLTTALPAVIGFNFDELKTDLTERLYKYNNLVVTEDAIQAAKTDRANLRKLKDALDTRRKDVKRQYEKPIKEFEGKVKELTLLIDKPIAAIDSQIKVYEEQKKQEKQQKISEAYDTIVPEALRDIIPLTAIASPKWLNATTSMKSVEEELTDRVKRTNADMMVLDTVEPEYSAAVRETYIRTLDIERAMNQKKALQEAAEAFKQREAAKAAEDAKTPAQPVQEPVNEPTVVQPAEEQMYVLRLEMHLTKNQAIELKRFLANRGIEYTKI